MAEETTEAKKTETSKPAEPTDDLVSTKHHLKVGRRTLDYTATTGRVVLRDEVYEDGRFTGYKAKAEISLTSYIARRRDPRAGRSPSRSTAAPAAPACGCTSGCSVRAGC